MGCERCGESTDYIISCSRLELCFESKNVLIEAKTMINLIHSKNPKMYYRNGCLCPTRVKYLKWGQFIPNFDKQKSKERPDKIIGNGGIIRKIAFERNNIYRLFVGRTHTHTHTQPSTVCVVSISRIFLFLIQWSVLQAKNCDLQILICSPQLLTTFT